MNANTVAVVSVSVTGALALAQLLMTWRLTIRTQRHATELATIESNRDDVKNAHAGLYRKLASYLRAGATPAGVHPYQQSGPEQWETWQAFDESLSEVWLMASPEAARLGEAAVGAVADLAEYGDDESEGARASYQRAEKAIADYRAAIRHDRGLE